MKKILLLFGVLLVFCGCKTTRDIQITEMDKITLHDTLIVRDTITSTHIIRDSVSVFVKDTSFVDTSTGVRHHYHETIKYIERDQYREENKSLREECSRLREESKQMVKNETITTTKKDNKGIWKFVLWSFQSLVWSVFCAVGGIYLYKKYVK